MSTDRLIYRRSGSRQVSELLSGIFVSELISPSRNLWLNSPWISNLTVLDSRADQFVALNPTWSRSGVTLVLALVHLASNGCRVRVITRNVPTNSPFIEELKRAGDNSKINIEIHYNNSEHAKGLVTDRVALWGSMNFTENGISINRELVEYTTNPKKIAQMSVELDADFAP